MRKVASRYLLPLEMLMGLVSVATGLAGGLGGGVLFDALQASGDMPLWVGGFCLTGICTTAVSSIEWFTGRRWELERIFHSVSMRTWLALASASGWMIGFFWLCMEAQTIVALTFITPICAVFSAWSYVENYKVKDALDDKVATSEISFHR